MKKQKNNFTILQKNNFTNFSNKSIKSHWIFYRPWECFFHRGKYYVCRGSIPSYRIGNSIGRCSIPSCGIGNSVDHHDILAKCGSTLSAVGVFPQLY